MRSMTTILEDVTVPEVLPHRGPMWRVVLGSMATGLVLALLLVFVVFTGGREYVITGSALVAFAAGWAMLAVLSARLTTQPQRWAFVPAAFMAFAGVVLFVTSPGDAAITDAGWVWPPIVLALSVWMFVQVRRSLVGRVRWVLYPLVAMLFAGSVGGGYETIAIARDQHDYTAPGTLYDVDGHRLHLHCVGSGSPTVVLQNGLGDMSLIWSRIIAEVSATTRVCAYDRPGQGWSDDVADPQDGIEIAADLHMLLQVAGEHGPFVMAGHSSGGAYTLIYAAQYPDEVAGVVLLDSMSPHQFTMVKGYDTQFTMMTMGLAVAPSIFRFGVARMMPASAYSNLPEPLATEYRSFATSPRYMRNMRDEQSTFHDMLDQAQSLTTLGDTPLVVLTTTEQLDKADGWDDAQDQLAALSTDTDHRVVDATHGGMLDDPDAYAMSVDAILDVVAATR